MAVFDFGVAVNVMAAYLSGGSDEESMTSARQVADGHDPRDVIDSLVFLIASLINLRTGEHGETPSETIEQLRGFIQSIKDFA